MNILSLEDETDIGEPVVDSLLDDRYEVVWVRDVVAAHAAVAERAFDLLLVDVTLPRGEDAGFDFAREAREAGYAGVGGGMGLGPALVAFIAQTLAGDLTLRNLDPGFEATLRLPVVVSNASAG